MADDKIPVIVHVCGPSKAKCKCECGWGELNEQGRFRCDHIWDGPIEEFDEGRGSTATCSRCGMTAFSHAMWTAP